MMKIKLRKAKNRNMVKPKVKQRIFNNRQNLKFQNSITVMGFMEKS